MIEEASQFNEILITSATLAKTKLPFILLILMTIAASRNLF